MKCTSQRVAELLDHVQKGDNGRFKDFCTALENSNQPHIVALLCGDQPGVDVRDAQKVHDPEDMPLSAENGQKLRAHWNLLIERMNTKDSGLVGDLQTLDVFSCLQIKKLKASF